MIQPGISYFLLDSRGGRNCKNQQMELNLYTEMYFFFMVVKKAYEEVK